MRPRTVLCQQVQGRMHVHEGSLGCSDDAWRLHRVANAAQTMAQATVDDKEQKRRRKGKPKRRMQCAVTFDDPLSDVVGRLIVAMNAVPTWTREKRTIRENLLRRLKRENYYFFRGTLSSYPLATTGASIFYKVPENKTGRLARFRNKTIRLLRLGSRGLGSGDFAAKVFTRART